MFSACRDLVIFVNERVETVVKEPVHLQGSALPVADHGDRFRSIWLFPQHHGDEITKAAFARRFSSA